MQQPPDQQRAGLGLPPLDLLALLQHLPTGAKQALLRTSRAVREDVLMCAPTLTFDISEGGATSAASSRRQLRQLLQARTDPLRLMVDVEWDPTPQQMLMLLADLEHTPRPSHGVHGEASCCVRELVIKGVRAVHSWHGLVGAAFPHIHSLTVAQPSVTMLHGLAACSRLTTLNVASEIGEYNTGELHKCQHLVPTWLPHVHSLKLTRNGCEPIVAALAPQLHHLALEAHVPHLLPPCQQLVSLKTVLYVPNIEALLPLQHLRELELTKLGYDVIINRDFSTAVWSVQSLVVGTALSAHIDLEELARLPLRGLQQLVVKAPLQFEFKPTAAASRAVMHAACSALASVPSLILHRPLLSVDSWEVTAADMEAALVGLQPIAHALAPRLELNLRTPEGFVLGGEVLRGLHAAFGPLLTQLHLRIMSLWRNVECSPEFWSALPGVLPSLTALDLHCMSLVGGDSVAALCAACAQLKNSSSGRRLTIRFSDVGCGREGMHSAVQQLSMFQPEVCVLL